MNKNNEIICINKVLDEDECLIFKYIKNFAQFYLDQISTGFTRNSKIIFEEGWFDPSNIERFKKIYKSIAIRQFDESKI